MKEFADELTRWREHPAAMVRELFQTEPDKWQEEALEKFPHAPQACITRDYLAGNGDLSDLPGDVEIVGSETDPNARILFKTKIKASDRLTALGFMAKVAGWFAPEKQEVTTQVTLEQLVNESLKPKESAA